MSKSLEKEYKAMMNDQLPDLWTRIESSLEEKESVSETEPLTEKESKKNTKIFRFLPYAAAAACVCLIITGIAYSGVLNHGMSSSASQEATASAAYDNGSNGYAEELYGESNQSASEMSESVADTAESPRYVENIDNEEADTDYTEAENTETAAVYDEQEAASSEYSYTDAEIKAEEIIGNIKYTILNFFKNSHKK